MRGDESVRKEVEEEKAKLKTMEREWMGKMKKSEEAKYAVQARLEGVERDRRREKEEAAKHQDLLRRQLEQKEREVDTLRDVQARTRALEEQLEAKDRQLEDVRSLLSNRPADDLRAELKRQSTLLTTLERTNAQLSRECQDLRLRRDQVESLQSEVKALARRAQVAEEKLAVVNQQLDQSRREME